MDINTFRIAVTLVTFAAFLGIVVWAYWPSRRQALEEQGRSILEDNAS
jgi:cbb3-type cytochrome oxidase subunit 3